MEQPLVSIIVPIYNAQKHIARCVESIRRQSYPALEILLLNDGSQDVSYEVCQMYAGIDKRIVLIDKANSGVAATRNLGLRYASGDYLQFVDADDTLEPDATRLLVEKATAHQADLVIAHYNRVTPPADPPELSRLAKDLLPDGTVERLSTPRPTKIKAFGFLPEGFMDKTQFAQGLMQEPASFYYGVMWNKLYRAALVREHTDVICSEELNWSEDLYFNLSFIRYAERFYSLAVPVYNYLQNPESICHTKLNPINVLTTRASLFAYYKQLYESLGLYEENKVQIFKYLVSIAES
ncbi:MAG: glycosyltransferase family 2 protein [Gemmiger sp.]|nr:glycosyltransferase family 2 protein [Gemmiger sp.]